MSEQDSPGEPAYEFDLGPAAPSPGPSSDPDPTPPPEPNAEPTGEAPDIASQTTMALVAHLLGPGLSFLCCCCVLLWPVGPLIIWLMNKDKNKPFVEEQAKEALNFQLTILFIGLVVSLFNSILMWILSLMGWPWWLGSLPMIFVVLANIALGIMAALKVKDGESYRYPFCLRLIK